MSVVFFDRKLKLDDPVGATSVHLVCGIWGTLAVGIFGAMASWAQFLEQLIGVVSIGAFAFSFSYILITIIKVTMGIRVEEEEEVRGLDMSEHDMEAYADIDKSYAFAVK